MNDAKTPGSIDSIPQSPKKPRRRFSWRLSAILLAIIVIAAVGYVFVPKLLHLGSNEDSGTNNVLTIDDLDKADVELGSNTSGASVENLTKQLKAKVEKQIADKQNPIDTVLTLVSMLRNTANAERQNEAIDYVTTFLDTKMDALKLDSDEYGTPDTLRTTYWRAQLYAHLVYSYKFIMDNQFTGSDGKPRNTASEQLKYVNLYLDIAQNSANWGEPQTSQEDGRTWYYYNYDHTEDFIELRDELKAGGAL